MSRRCGSRGRRGRGRYCFHKVLHDGGHIVIASQSWRRGCSRPGGTCGVFWCSVSIGGGLSGVLVSLHLSVGPPQTQCTIHGPLYQWHGCQASLYQCPDGQAPSQWPRGQSLCHMAAGDSDASSGSSEKVGCSAPPGAEAGCAAPSKHRKALSRNFFRLKCCKSLAGCAAPGKR